MIITSLKAENWGRHKSIDFDCNGDIVGVLGSNGSGKSTVLALVEFLLTGETRDTLESYVRNGNGNASGTMQFVKNGQTGTIFRQVGKTSKRWLEWGSGSRLTKAAEVDRAMIEIFGADKKAMANSVFVSQGTLEKVLFEEGVDRTKAFLRLVNLSFCEQRVAMIGAQIAKVSSLVVDLTPARDEAAMAKLGALQTMNQKADELAVAPDHSEALKYLHGLRQCTTELDLVQKQLGETRIQLATKQSEMTAKLGEDTSTNLLLNLRSAEVAATQYRSEEEHYRSILGELQHYSRIKTEIGQLRLEDDAATRSIDQKNCDKLSLSQTQSELGGIEVKLRTYDRKRSLDARMQSEQVALLQAQTQVAEVQAAALEVPESDLGPLRQKVQAHKDQLIEIRRWLAFQAKLANWSAKQEACCPECRQSLAEVPTASTAMLELQRTSERTLVAELTTMQRAIEQAENAIRQQQVRLAQLNGAVQTRQSTIVNIERELLSLVFQEDEENLLHRKTILVDLEQALRTWSADHLRRTQDVTNKTKLLGNYGLAKQYWEDRADYTNTGLGEKQRLREQTAKEYQLQQQQWNSIQGLEGQLKAIQAAVDQHESRIATLTYALKATDTPDAVTRLLPECNDDLTQVEAKLTASEQVRSSLAAVYASSVEAYQTANARYQDLEARILQNQKKIELLRDLHRLRDLLNNDGLPLLFIKMKFKRLAAYTQDSLAKIGANFCVNIDPERPLEFSFRRLDEDDAVEQPMHKLSGGQRVRLCVAFLMALQKTLLQEVGLLVLDEPLSGLDADGKAQVVAFLAGLKGELKNSEHQIWAVDHNPELEAALDKSLVLTN